jgi:homoserine dehydrogenase
VHPTLIPAKRLLANVEGAMNAVMVKGDAVGTTLYYGKVLAPSRPRPP